MYGATVGVIGGGPWGLGLAAAAARTGSRALIHSRRKLEALPHGVEQVSDLTALGKEARMIVLAVPSEVARGVARSLGDVVDGRHLLVHGIRGLEVSTAKEDVGAKGAPRLLAISEVLRQETPARRIGALGGPILSEDLLKGTPSALVSASRYPEVNDAIAAAFGTPLLRIYASSDLVGVEWASALVGCLGLAVGYGQALGLSAGAMAALVSRGVEEAARMASAAGGVERTLLGLAGYGDLLASIAEKDRPEVLLGAALARGKSVEEAAAEAGQRVEAVELIPCLAAWAEERKVPTPIFQALAKGVLSGRPADSIVKELMALPAQRLA